MPDVLVINSAPGSGQFHGYDQLELAFLAGRLADKGHAVVATAKLPDRIDNVGCTEKLNYSVTQIGALSLHCHTILMVSTGPSWPTFNIWNQESVKRRIILIDSERIELAPNTVHCSKVADAAAILDQDGLL